MRILIVEDNADIVANLYAYLETARICARQLPRMAMAGLALAAQHDYDANRSGCDLAGGWTGLSLCHKLRRRTQETNAGC